MELTGRFRHEDEIPWALSEYLPMFGWGWFDGTEQDSIDAIVKDYEEEVDDGQNASSCSPDCRT